MIKNAICRSLYSAYSRPAHRKFIASTVLPEQDFLKLWQQTEHLVRAGSFWRKSFRTQAKLIPLNEFDITDYKTYQAAFDSDYISSSKISSLSGERLESWLLSSGTTNTPKRFPMTQSYCDQVMDCILAVNHQTLLRSPAYLSKSILQIIATSTNTSSPQGIIESYISNYLLRRFPKAYLQLSALPLEVFASQETFDEWAPLYAMAADISAIQTPVPRTIHKLFDGIVARRDELLPYVVGEKAVPKSLPQVRVSKKRIKHLRATADQGQLTLSNLWPSLRLIRCWRSSSCQLQLAALKVFLDDNVAIFDSSYMASEAAMTVTMGDNAIGGVVAGHAIITEYLKAGDTLDAKNLVQAWDLVPGHEYEVFITNKMGLIRYRLEDVVRCNGFFNRLPIIEFVQKVGARLVLGPALGYITETQILDAFVSSGVSLNGRWLLGRNKTGTGLNLYYSDFQSDIAAVVRKIEGSLKKANYFYDLGQSSGQACPIEPICLPASHFLWTRSEHVHTKDKLFTQKEFSEIVLDAILDMPR